MPIQRVMYWTLELIHVGDIFYFGRSVKILFVFSLFCIFKIFLLGFCCNVYTPTSFTSSCYMMSEGLGSIIRTLEMSI